MPSYPWYWSTGVWREPAAPVVGRPNRGKRRNVKAGRRAARHNR